ncbi:DgyrCDS10711 [Dimorphilus gyrociliatus]|uniref:DgyrCDS10711 n=1 Tax=Dimorphilus gyrociliatus TaxID=2664684 RepID=A0A7I8W2F3_9ANNE|nr:DgyrCDS10711 [Dimorphilus gyrociliatus]
MRQWDRIESEGNIWASFAGDDETSIVHMASLHHYFDYCGGNRIGDDLYTDSVIALQAHSRVKLRHNSLLNNYILTLRDRKAGTTISNIKKVRQAIKIVLYYQFTQTLFIYFGKEVIVYFIIDFEKNRFLGKVARKAQTKTSWRFRSIGERTQFDMSLVNYSLFNNTESCIDILLDVMKVYNGFFDSEPSWLIPCHVGPYATMIGINLNNTTIKWKAFSLQLIPGSDAVMGAGSEDHKILSA